jgi:hypothetical protein
MKRLHKLAMVVVARVLELLRDYDRQCYICWVPITDLAGRAYDHHLCSECHASTRKLAKRRRKEWRQRAKRLARVSGTAPAPVDSGVGP